MQDAESSGSVFALVDGCHSELLAKIDAQGGILY